MFDVQEWKDELWPLSKILENNQEKEEDEDYRDLAEKLSAVYGVEWKSISPENLMDYKHFKEIPEFLRNAKKLLTCESVSKIIYKCIMCWK